MNCPFCGKNRLKLDSKKTNNKRFMGSIKEVSYAASVRCNCCHDRGPTVSIWVRDGQYNANIILEEAAYTVWNTRV